MYRPVAGVDMPPKGVLVLRYAVEELLRVGWDAPFRRRAWEVASAFEGVFRASGQKEAAAIVHTLTLLLDIEPEETVMLGKNLEITLLELLRRLEKCPGEDGVQTG
jgi:hypothetical protein